MSVTEVQSAYPDSGIIPTLDDQEPLQRVDCHEGRADYINGRDELAHLIATVSDYQPLFARMMEVVRGFVPFDWAYFFIFTDGREYSRIVCHYGPEIPFQSRWFATGEGYRDWITGAVTWMDDFKTSIATGPHPELLESPDYQRVIDAGVKALVCLPVQEGGKVVGGICLQSKHEAYYNEEARRKLERLMLSQVLLSVFHAAKYEESEFVSGLLTEIAASKDFEELAQTVVTKIANFYRFQNVSILKVNALRGHFRLLAQASGPGGGAVMPEGYTQPIDKGLLGLCYRRKTHVLLSDATCNSPEARIYIATAPGMRSELCVPIEMSGRVLWILNLEAKHTDAFTLGEVETLKNIIGQMQASLTRIFQRLVLAQVLDVVPEAVLITEQSGRVMHPTKDALRMFERDATGNDLSRFVSGFSALGSSPTLTKVVGEHGKETSVLATKVTLEDEYDHNVVVLQDVTELQWKTDRENLTAALAETAAQVRVPVSLLSSFIRQIGDKVEDKELQDLARKAMRQLDRIELTYDRVLACYGAQILPAAQEALLDVNLVLHHILSELPRLERRTVRWSTVNRQARVKGDPYRVLFALNSMIAYLLRSRTNAKPIVIKVRMLQDTVEVSMTGAVQQTTPPLGELAAMVETTRTEIALGADTLAQIAAACGGTFERRPQGKERERLSLRLVAVT